MRTSAIPTLVAASFLLASCEAQPGTKESPTTPLAPAFATVTSGVINVPGDYSTIQAAIVAAVPGDVIVVGPGTYPEKIDFLGKAITLRSSAGPDFTIIDGAGSPGSVVTAVRGEGETTVLEGFTITGGNALEGGGMRNVGSSPTVRDCIFSGNSATDRGGGMYNEAGSPTIIRTHFKLNSATAMGGGVFNLQASPEINESRFSQNTASKGGGMRNYLNSHPRVTDCVFDNNQAGEEGGGMDNRKNSNPIVLNCLFVGNSAPSGGAMHNYVGARVDPTGNPTLINVVMVGNSASEGGGMRNNDPNPLVLNSTIAFNDGSGISSRNGSSPVIQNTIVWGNTGGSFSGKSAKTSDVTYSDIEGGFSGEGNLDIDPMFVDPLGHDLHLVPGSPLIDAGYDHDWFHPPPPEDPVESDYDGNPRVVCAVVDMGAFEYDGGTCGTTNYPPTVTIDFPSDAASFDEGAIISFAGSASDPEDGDLTPSMNWTSDLDGTIGTGGSFSRALTVGAHAITASVTDSDGVTRNDYVAVTVTSGSGGVEITLTVTGRKIKGTKYADLVWSGASSANVDILRDSGPLSTIMNGGTFTDDTLGKGGGSYTYQVCEAGTSNCSNVATVSF